MTNAPPGKLEASSIDRFSCRGGNMGEFCFSCCIAPSQDVGSRSLTPEKSKLLKLCKFCKNCCLAAIDNCRNANFWQFSQSCYVIRGMGGEFCKMLEEFKSGSSHSWKNAPQDEYTEHSGGHPSSQHQLPPQLVGA